MSTHAVCPRCGLEILFGEDTVYAPTGSGCLGKVHDYTICVMRLAEAERKSTNRAEQAEAHLAKTETVLAERNMQNYRLARDLARAKDAAESLRDEVYDLDPEHSWDARQAVDALLADLAKSSETPTAGTSASDDVRFSRSASLETAVNVTREPGMISEGSGQTPIGHASLPKGLMLEHGRLDAMWQQLVAEKDAAKLVAKSAVEQQELATKRAEQAEAQLAALDRKYEAALSNLESRLVEADRAHRSAETRITQLKCACEALQQVSDRLDFAIRHMDDGWARDELKQVLERSRADFAKTQEGRCQAHDRKHPKTSERALDSACPLSPGGGSEEPGTDVCPSPIASPAKVGVEEQGIPSKEDCREGPERRGHYPRPQAEYGASGDKPGETGASPLDDAPLHALWSKAVGTPGYDKKEWIALESKLHAALRAHSPFKGILLEIVDERIRQDWQWGGPDHDAAHNAWDWCAYILKQLAHMQAEATVEKGAATFRSRMIKIAALAVAGIQAHDRAHASALGGA